MTEKILPPLYLVTDRHQTLERPLRQVLQETLHAGTRLVQLREKDLSSRALLSLAQDVREDTRQQNALLLINDRVDIAKAVGADGVHLRADSLPISRVRDFLGPEVLIGKSTHALDDVLAAESDGANFIVFGPIYDTPSKRRFGPAVGRRSLEQVTKRCRIPVYAIGGITSDHVPELQDAGAYGVAVISAILQSVSVTTSTRQFLELLESRS